MRIQIQHVEKFIFFLALHYHGDISTKTLFCWVVVFCLTMLALPWSYEQEPLPIFYAGEVWELLQGFRDPYTTII